MNTAMWFRNDLRVWDNPALHAAQASGKPVMAFYFYTPDQHAAHSVGANKLRFILESVVALSNDLNKAGIPLLVIKSTDFKTSVKQLAKLCQKHDIAHVYANEEIELNEQIRDSLAESLLSEKTISLHYYQDQTLLAPTDVLTGKGTPYRVFTAFKRAWIQRIVQSPLTPTPAIKKQKKHLIERTNPDDILRWAPAQYANQFWVAGSQEAYSKLDRFSELQLIHYKDQRDHPDIEATSKLSPYLAVGAISLKSCLLCALQLNNGEFTTGNIGIQTWINELIWREFYKHMIYHNPDLCKGKAFQPKTDHIPWKTTEKTLLAWQQGKTGFPFVDAGMRQLNTTGWMHNRLRMVTAMFLTKQLFIDWRLGEKYFMSKLIDADFSANNGGWQWSASTGADAAPYFRVFNPTRQSERFDKSGDFIRQWVPELQGLDSRSIHNPSPMERQLTHYPEPIIDHQASVIHVKQQFQMAQSLEPT